MKPSSLISLNLHISYLSKLHIYTKYANNNIYFFLQVINKNEIMKLILRLLKYLPVIENLRIAGFFFISLLSIDENSIDYTFFPDRFFILCWSSEYSLDYGRGHEPGSWLLRRSGCQHPEYRRTGQTKREIHQCLCLRPRLLAFTILPDSRVLPDHSRHPADAFRFPPAPLHERLPLTFTKKRLLQ